VDIFKRKYKLRRYAKQEFVGGYSKSSYTESEIKLDVQPAGDDVEVTAEGRRAYKKLTVYCDSELRIDDQQKGTKADLILVDGVWYTCTSCQKWRNTILAHWQASFSAVPETEMQR
jgi:hypothetical protein